MYILKNRYIEVALDESVHIVSLKRKGGKNIIDLKKPYYVVREYRAGAFPDRDAPPFAIAAESDSFIESMNILYAPETPKISREQVKM